MPEQKLFNGVAVPLVLHCQRPNCTAADTVAWVANSLPYLAEKLSCHGAAVCGSSNNMARLVTAPRLAFIYSSSSVLNASISQTGRINTISLLTDASPPLHPHPRTARTDSLSKSSYAFLDGRARVMQVLSCSVVSPLRLPPISTLLCAPSRTTRTSRER